MLIYDDDSAWSSLPEDERAALRAAEMPKWVALFEELGKADPNVSGKELDGRSTAKVVRVRNGERIVTDGPFAETKELLGGYYIVDVPDLDTALAHAARMPNVGYGSIEVRPVVDFSQTAMAESQAQASA
jgi:hypothetical protein